VSEVKHENVRITECRACNGYYRLPDEPGLSCRYCNGDGYTRERVARALTADEQAYIQRLIKDGELEADWNEV
jgi:DnaJ-class molecular chaperone